MVSENGLDGSLSPCLLLGGWGGADVIMTREIELSSSDADHRRPDISSLLPFH
ncbi:MAG: hypothetical protein MZV63_47290 [Marinilabiliales bacterium]|nr:hypothetical protein [Marinilabiliales bacterium]